MLRPALLVMLLCPLLFSEDPAVLAAHIGGATRPEHLATLVPKAKEMPAAVRRQLITHLTAMEMPDSIPLLAQLLPLADESEAQQILHAYVNISHERAVPALIAACQDPRPEVRTLAWDTLARTSFRGNAILRSFLREQLADPQHPFRLSAAMALYEVGTADEIRTAEEIILTNAPTNDSVRYYQRQILSRRGDPRIFALVHGDLQQEYEVIGMNAQVNAAMDIGKALQAGAPLQDETRRLLLHTIRVCPHPDPASFAARALRDCRDPASYPVLLELLGHSQADEEIVEALCAIDPVRALADWRHLLRTADELRLFSAILYGTHHAALHPAFSELIALRPMDIDDATRSRRHYVLMELLSSSWPSVNGDTDPAPRITFVARCLQDADPALVRRAVRIQSRQASADLTPDLITRVRAWAEHGNQDEREDAISVMCDRPALFGTELATLVRTTNEFPMNHWLLRTCCKHGGIIPADELADLVYAHFQKDRSQSTVVAWYTTLFATAPGEDRAFELLFTHYGRSSEQRALMTRGAVSGIRPLRLQSFVRRWDVLDDVQRAALITQLAECPKDTARFGILAERVSAYADTRDSDRLVAGLAALTQHDLSITPEHLAYQLVERGLAHLATLPMGDPWSTWGRLRQALLRVAKTNHNSYVGSDNILSALVHADPRQRAAACVMVQMAGAADALDQDRREHLLPQLFVTAASESVAIRSEAARALALMVRAEDFPRLRALFLTDPASRVPLAAALRASDPQRAEEFFRAERARLHLDDLDIGLNAQAPAPMAQEPPP